ncbi:G-protein-signaling modulator 2 isoform X2 [Ictalurus punctatus]|uniref:G-protein-signaling modulator 2 isoform X2 n=1 Tax=Ictalurus punctatus TaxID=7998 RepID=A0A2D0PRD7_ICTPU|nr:G-protein-signaling modulator 2 isoform X2 [Ictalurus punctatus]
MDCAEVKGQIPAEEQLEPLVILEEGDELDDFTHISARGKGVLRVKKENMEDMIKGSSEGSTDSENDVEVESQQKEGLEYINQKIEGVTETEENPEVKIVQTRPGLVMGKAEEEMEGLKTKAVPKEESLADSQPSAKLRPRDRLSPEDAQQKVHRLSPDSPDALYELLCALQEGRRLNDQRCSFTLQPRRRCHSEPGTPRHNHKVVFSSMTSLQKEEFFDLVATSQARRLDDQRAAFQGPSPETPARLPQEPRRPSSAPETFSQPRPKSRRSSWKVMEFGQSVPKPAAKEELYNMILSSQAQGRLEEQRSKAPGPMDDEDFFSLLLKVQGGRLDEQRTELPVALRY